MTPEERRIANQIFLNRQHLRKYEKMKMHCAVEIMKLEERNKLLEDQLHQLQRQRIGLVYAQNERDKRTREGRKALKDWKALLRAEGQSEETIEIIEKMIQERKKEAQK